MVSYLGQTDSMVFICPNWSMACWSTVDRWETVLELVTEGCILVSDHMLSSILTMLVNVLALWAGDLMPKYLLSFDVCLPVLPLCHFLWSLVRLELGEFVEVSPLGCEPSLAHFVLVVQLP